MRITDYELLHVPPRWRFLKVKTPATSLCVGMGDYVFHTIHEQDWRNITWRHQGWGVSEW